MEGSSIRSELATGVFVCSAQAFLRLGLATTVLTGGALLLAGELSFLYFLGFLFAAARLYDPLGVVLQNIAATFNTKLQIERMRSILEQPVQTGDGELPPDRYDITFDHVSFAYREGAGVLEDVSFTARQGEVTALIGPSGGGKSTACKLAARFWDVTGGRYPLGGTDVSTVDPEALLRSYSMVFQDVVLFRDTVMENIRLGRRGATDEEVLAAARAAQCDDFIRKLPQGYQTVIGENGSTLSGGERQRISIARALLKDAPVVLLDEATASLDVENESAVQAALSRLLQGKTVLVIAHRMRTVAGADHIVVLEDGHVAQQGSPGGADGAGRPLPPHGGAPERERPVAAAVNSVYSSSFDLSFGSTTSSDRSSKIRTFWLRVSYSRSFSLSFPIFRLQGGSSGPEHIYFGPEPLGGGQGYGVQPFQLPCRRLDRMI